MPLSRIYFMRTFSLLGSLLLLTNCTSSLVPEYLHLRSRTEYKHATNYPLRMPPGVTLPVQRSYYPLPLHTTRNLHQAPVALTPPGL